MDALHWDTFSYAGSDNEWTSSEDGEWESDNEQDDTYPKAQAERLQQKQDRQDRNLAWWLGTSLAEWYIPYQEQSRRRECADRERRRAARASAEAPCEYCGSLPRSCNWIDASGRHHRDTQGSCGCYSSWEDLPREPIDAHSRPVPAAPTVHVLPAVAELLDKERREPTVAAPFVVEPLFVGQKEVIRDETRTWTTTTEKTSTIAQPLTKGEKELAPKEAPSSSNIRVPRYTLGLLSPVRLVSGLCIFTGTRVFLNAMGTRSPWKGGCLGLLLAGSFAYHDVLLVELGWTTCGLNAILRWL